jgi:hypothetical protein
MNVEQYLEANGLSLVEHLIDEWTGRVGRAVHSAEGVQLSPVLARPSQLVDWIEENRTAVSDARARGVSPVSGPLAARTLAALAKQSRKLDQAERKLVESAERNRRLLGAEGWEDMADHLREGLADDTAKLVALAVHRDRVNSLAERCKADPASLFLPVGATVRLTRNLSKPAWALEGGFYGPFPAVGSTGVVLGPAIDLNAEFPVRVAFADDFMDADGKTRWQPGREQPISMAISPEDLEVVELGTYLDGTPCRSLEFVKTHFHGDDREGYGEMVVVSSGKPMRIMGFDLGKDSHWVSGQGWESVAEMDFLTPVARLDAAAPEGSFRP